MTLGKLLSGVLSLWLECHMLASKPDGVDVQLTLVEKLVPTLGWYYIGILSTLDRTSHKDNARYPELQHTDCLSHYSKKVQIKKYMKTVGKFRYDIAIGQTEWGYDRLADY